MFMYPSVQAQNETYCLLLLSSSWSPFFGFLESELLLRSFLMSLGDSTLSHGNLQCQLVQCFPLPFPLGSLPPLGTLVPVIA